ncbi:NOL1/NOP2/sun family putative RNA met [Aspergillus campestris IBT 28561]|uniref:Nucleolar protein 2 n=1 Tax=Aspergillus campestris (strain IBT 28561) TaxID=1392248 RepID=A0A2I1DFI4_ASPC2|nr:NOL1/NOP2/sun family putative RNA met [Aspergillus campestris IBT 28561]PKY08634.1 NOL1/NOP2/sun family putative RNA met [Aspergillus campestris IBT 28561]
MGVGRRMKKQGPPAPLDAETISMIKKRKAGGDVQGNKTEKRRKAEDLKPVKAPKKTNGAAVNGTTAKKVVEEKSKGKSKPVEKKRQILESDDEDEDMSGIEEADMDDEFDDLDGVSDGSMGSSQEEDSLVDSDEEDHPREAMFSDDDSDAEEKLTAANIEGLSRKLDLEREAEEEEAEREMQEAAMQTNIAGDRPDVFGTETGHPGMAPDLQLLRTRITDTIRILGDLKTLGQPGKSRAEYVQFLINDICTYYGYTPYLAEKLFNLFSPMEAFAFFEANETARPVVLRTNTLRTNRRSLAQALINRGVVLEPVGKWSKVGLQVFESAVPLGATPEYLAGHYILQAASSFLPVMALAPQPDERVLDMAAAPGGKTTYISALMRNTGCVIANDASKPRAKGLIGNIHRLGCKNTIVTNLDAREGFPHTIGGFDRVLLDAPCTGTGVIAKDPSVKTSKTERDFLAIPHMQRQLLLAAIDSVNHASKTGGYVVYSTCSVTVEENEAVVQYVLKKRPNVKLVDTGLGDFGSPGFTKYQGKHFDQKMTLTRRYFPHRENVDGFFVSKFKKTGPSPTTTAPADGAAASADSKPKKASSASSAASTDDEDVIDKTPITDEDGMVPDSEGGAFGPFEDNADDDKERILRAERNRLRRKGLNPKAVLNKPKKAKDETKPAETPAQEDKKDAAPKQAEKKADKKDEKKADKKEDKKKPKKETKKDTVPEQAEKKIKKDDKKDATPEKKSKKPAADASKGKKGKK